MDKPPTTRPSGPSQLGIRWIRQRPQHWATRLGRICCSWKALSWLQRSKNLAHTHCPNKNRTWGFQAKVTLQSAKLMQNPRQHIIFNARVCWEQLPAQEKQAPQRARLASHQIPYSRVGVRPRARSSPKGGPANLTQCRRQFNQLWMIIPARWWERNCFLQVIPTKWHSDIFILTNIVPSCLTYLPTF